MVQLKVFKYDFGNMLAKLTLDKNKQYFTESGKNGKNNSMFFTFN